jgi:hypothetical protein
MNYVQLKTLSENILKDFEKILCDLSSLAGYVYDKKTMERLERLYGEDIEKSIYRRLTQFQNAYIKRLNFLCKRARKEMKTAIQINEELTSKLKFWSVVYKSKSVEIINQRYQEAVSQNNRDFIYFVENILGSHKSEENHKRQIQRLTEAKRKQRVKKETRSEINDLNKLYGFYLQSLEFTRNRNLNLTKIEKLFSSLNKNFQLPLKDIVAAANKENSSVITTTPS